MKRIVIADEQPLMRASLRSMLETEGYQVLAEFDDGRDALRYVQSQRTDLLIVEMALPRLGGLELIRRLRKLRNPVQCLVLTTQNTEHYAGLALQAGSAGFIGKQAPLSDLRNAVASILRGRSYFPTQALVSFSASPAGNEADQLKSLSPRELTVLRYLATGKSIKYIAGEMAINDRTVSTYKTRLLTKLNVKSLAELLELCWRNRLLDSLADEAATSEERVELTLREQFHVHFDDLQQAICLRDGDSRLLAANRFFCSYHGVKEEDQLGSRIIDSVSLPPEQALRLYSGFHHAYLADSSFSCHLTIQRNAQTRILRHWSSPYHDSAGGRLGMICGTFDITRSEEQLLELKEAKRRLETLQQRRQSFLAGAGQRGLEMLDAALGNLTEATASSAAGRSLARAQRTLQELRGQFDALLQLNAMETYKARLNYTARSLERLTEQSCLAWATQFDLPPPQIHYADETTAWIDAESLQRIVGVALRYAARLDAQELALEIHPQAMPSAQVEWQLILRSTRLETHGNAWIGPEEILCQRLSTLMGGMLTFSEQSTELVRLTLRLDRSMAD